MPPKFFATSRAFRSWLEKNHARAGELVVGFYKVGSGRKSITWPESVDQALCFGWIDGVRKGIDEESYSIRFTPRRRGSIWSAVNVKRVEELKKLGLMTEAGLRAYEARDEKKSAIYSYEREAATFPPEYEQQFRANNPAFAFFSAQPPWYRRTLTYWVMSAKKEETRLRRLATLITESEAGRKMRG